MKLINKGVFRFQIQQCRMYYLH